MTTTTEPPTGNGTELAARPAAIQRTVVEDAGQFANLLDTAKFEHMWRVAKVFSSSAMVPQTFQGRPEDCFVAIQMAIRLGVDPFMFLQNTYVYQGKPGMQGQLAIALVNSSGIFDAPLRFEFAGTGDEYGCRAWANMRSTGERIDGPRVTIKLAKEEGWYGRNQKWRTSTDLMLTYRAGAWFGRTKCPERLMGMQTVEELRDLGGAEPTAPQTAPTRGVAGLMQQIAGKPISLPTEDEISAAQDANTPTASGVAGDQAAPPESAGGDDPDTSGAEAEHRASDGGDALAAEVRERELQEALAGEWSHVTSLMADAAEKAGMSRSDANRAIAARVKVVLGVRGKEQSIDVHERRRMYEACAGGRLTLAGAITPEER